MISPWDDERTAHNIPSTETMILIASQVEEAASAFLASVLLIYFRERRTK